MSCSHTKWWLTSLLHGSHLITIIKKDRMSQILVLEKRKKICALLMKTWISAPTATSCGNNSTPGYICKTWNYCIKKSLLHHLYCSTVEKNQYMESAMVFISKRLARKTVAVAAVVCICVCLCMLMCMCVCLWVLFNHEKECNSNKLHGTEAPIALNLCI